VRAVSGREGVYYIYTDRNLYGPHPSQAIQGVVCVPPPPATAPAAPPLRVTVHTLRVLAPGPNLDPTWTPPGPNLDPTWTQPGPNLDPTWTQPGPNLDLCGENRNGPEKVDRVRTFDFSVQVFRTFFCGRVDQTWTFWRPEYLPPDLKFRNCL
jgi:hypothetical protein